MGGFTLPFYVVGAATLAVTPLTAILIPELHYTTQSIPGKTCSLIGILKLPMVFMVAIVVVVVSITWSFLDPTLEPHLRKFELSPEMVGLLFLLLSATYGLLCPLWGWLVDRIKNYCWMMPIGLLINGISLLFLGPSQILVNIEDSVLLKVVTLSLLGVAVAMALMPTYQGLADGAIEGGYPDNVYMQSIVSGIWSCVYSLGEVIGPILGGFILEYFSFQMTATVVAVINFSAALFLVLYFSKRKSVTMECSEKKGINDMIDRDGVFGSSIKVISVNGSGCSFAQAKCVTKNNVNGACTFSISK